MSVASHEGGQNSPRVDLLLISDLKNKFKSSQQELREQEQKLQQIQKQNLVLKQMAFFNQKLDEKKDNELYNENLRLNFQISKLNSVIDLMNKEMDNLRNIIQKQNSQDPLNPEDKIQIIEKVIIDGANPKILMVLNQANKLKNQIKVLDAERDQIEAERQYYQVQQTQIQNDTQQSFLQNINKNFLNSGIASDQLSQVDNIAYNQNIINQQPQLVAYEHDQNQDELNDQLFPYNQNFQFVNQLNKDSSADIQYARKDNLSQETENQTFQKIIVNDNSSEYVNDNRFHQHDDNQMNQYQEDQNIEMIEEIENLNRQKYIKQEDRQIKKKNQQDIKIINKKVLGTLFDNKQDKIEGQFEHDQFENNDILNQPVSNILSDNMDLSQINPNYKEYPPSAIYSQQNKSIIFTPKNNTNIHISDILSEPNIMSAKENENSNVQKYKQDFFTEQVLDAYNDDPYTDQNKNVTSFKPNFQTKNDQIKMDLKNQSNFNEFNQPFAKKPIQIIDSSNDTQSQNVYMNFNQQQVLYDQRNFQNNQLIGSSTMDLLKKTDGSVMASSAAFGIKKNGLSDTLSPKSIANQKQDINTQINQNYIDQQNQKVKSQASSSENVIYSYVPTNQKTTPNNQEVQKVKNLLEPSDEEESKLTDSNVLKDQISQSKVKVLSETSENKIMAHVPKISEEEEINQKSQETVEVILIEESEEEDSNDDQIFENQLQIGGRPTIQLPVSPQDKNAQRMESIVNKNKELTDKNLKQNFFEDEESEEESQKDNGNTMKDISKIDGTGQRANMNESSVSEEVIIIEEDEEEEDTQNQSIIQNNIHNNFDVQISDAYNNKSSTGHAFYNSQQRSYQNSLGNSSKNQVININEMNKHLMNQRDSQQTMKQTEKVKNPKEEEDEEYEYVYEEGEEEVDEVNQSLNVEEKNLEKPQENTVPIQTIFEQTAVQKFENLNEQNSLLNKNTIFEQTAVQKFEEFD